MFSFNTKYKVEIRADEINVRDGRIFQRIFRKEH